MNYMLGSLNRTALGSPIGGVLFKLTPFVGGSEDDASIEETVRTGIIPVRIFPVYSPNKSKASLRFITSDGIYHRNPSLYMYIQPLDHTIWLWTGLVFILVNMVVVDGSMTREGGGSSGWAALKWCVYWIYGANLEQVDEPTLPPGATTTPPHEIKIHFKELLLSVIGLVCLLNNVYRAVLNLNYITGSDSLSSWHSVQQL